ncbi:MAG: adenylyltransferase/cytidyltransferase family protein [Oscillospiraceae bacterium]|nr:adenylyltransferase/cytidyltransferase family protein [Oscillospiraceae bacterium]
MQKIYKRGFYGGKFLPFHLGHLYCIQTASQQCDEVVVIFFANSEEEVALLKEEHAVGKDLLLPENRIRKIKEACETFGNVRFEILDCSVMHRKAIEEGTDLWDSETQYVLDTVGPFQAVYSSEPQYGDYFKRAYPFADHILVDPPRIHFPISGTKIRGMSIEEAAVWLNTENMENKNE